MRISPPPRCTPKSPTNTFAKSTSRPTPAPSKRSSLLSLVGNRPTFAGTVPVFLAIAAVAFACSGGGEAHPAAAPSAVGATQAAAVTPTAPSTGSDELPDRDLVDLAARLGGIQDPPRQVAIQPPAVGDVESFSVLMLPLGSDAAPQLRAVTATLRAASEHAYFFVEQGSGVGDARVDDAVRAFEDRVWPRVTEAFGLPAIPGVDGDPRIAILHADLGGSLGGYVADLDAYPTASAPRSNQRELVYMNLTASPIGSDAYTSTLAHEFQHLIHRNHDLGEEAWVNEGLSEVARELLGGGSAFARFLDRPNTQLNAWENSPALGAHYQGSNLFFAYLLEQTGGDAKPLLDEPADGVAGVRGYLRAVGADRGFEELVADWAVANFLDQLSGPYGYGDLQVGPPALTRIEGGEASDGDVPQFAADYLEIRAEDFEGAATFLFEGGTEVPQLAAQETADGAFWWSARGDSIDTTLTRELDLTGVDTATLTFRTWFDIERWFDWGYVTASTDGGRTWQVLAGDHTNTDDPLGVAYGPGYAGRSGGGDGPAWVDERIDLTPFAGSSVHLRFEYVTDDGLNETGWAIDDIAVPEIGFFDDGEADVGGWARAGFRRVSNPLPQRFQLRLITLGDAEEVEEIALDGGNRAEILLDGLGTEYRSAVLVVVGATEGTTEPASYSYELTTASGG